MKFAISALLLSATSAISVSPTVENDIQINQIPEEC